MGLVVVVAGGAGYEGQTGLAETVGLVELGREVAGVGTSHPEPPLGLAVLAAMAS